MDGISIYRTYASSIAHIVVQDGQGERVSSGTGFLVGDHLVTCAHVIDVPKRLPIAISFKYPEPDQTTVWRYPAGISQMQFRGWSGERAFDYAIIKPPHGTIVGPSLRFSFGEPVIGETVYGLGYPFEQEELTLTRGIISSDLQSGVARHLKLDMNVNPSNSGGPLIRESDGLVIGMIARKSTGLDKAFNSLVQSFDNNITALKASIGAVGLMGIDPIQMFSISQHQMKQVALNLRRSAQVGIGYAVHNMPLRDEAAFQKG